AGPVAPPHPGGGVWLEVQFDEKDHAKSLGAKWDPHTTMWFVPPGREQELAPWWALPAVLPWEDRSFGSGLFVDLVPESCWFTNVRSCVIPRDWFRIRKMVYGRAGNRCEACGAAPNTGSGVRMEAHERWLYDDATRTQYLRRLICLCAPCHLATHFGFAEVTGRRELALAQLRTVTGCTADQAVQHIKDAVVWWQSRSAVDWTLNLRMLADAGITITAPGDGADRRAAAERRAVEERAMTRPRGDFEPGMTIQPFQY
ncbi:MAG: DUF5710 domain-containing protein, partial [Pseudonocardiaceae bacterium]